MALKGIVIDAGHGGDDPGAIGNGITEKNLNLAIATYMYDRFKELGIPVKIIRNTDETISPTERTRRILEAYGNDPNVIVISNHINAGGGDGAEVIYALRNTSRLSNLILNELQKEGQNVRKAYQRRLPSDTSKDYYFIQRDTGVTEPVTVEYGFLDSTGDDVNQLKNNYENYAEAVVKAVSQYANLPYKSVAGGNSYVVQKGDSLYSISKKLNVPIEELKEANNLTSNLLNIGQILVIPQNEQPSNNVYIVQKGDSLYSIANKYNTTVSNLISINNLPNTNLSIGQELYINGVVEPIQENGIYYTVKVGDSLYSIARKYNISVNELKSYNNLTSNLLSIGQVLSIPTTNETTYIVKSGDSLYSIAKKFNTTVNEIKTKNNLTNNLLSIGQKLFV